MIDKLNEKALLTAGNRAFRIAVIRKLNQIVDALNVGVVWDNRVHADRSDKALGERIDMTDVGMSIAFVTLAEAGQIDDVTASEHPEMFEEWKPNMAYTEGQLRVDPLDGKLYRVNKGKSHTSLEGWNPSLCPSEWKLTSDPAVEFPEWSQPVGAHDAYGEGAKVTHKDKKWVSDEEGNVWEPGVYGWTEYVEPEV